jgi:aspartate 1-decarboxylase
MKSSSQQFKDSLDKAYSSLGQTAGDIDVMLGAAKLKGSLSEEDVDIKFVKPNFEHEFEEAKRYREFKRIPKKEWVDLAKDGSVTSFSKIKNYLGNVDLDFEKLDKDKKGRFHAAFKNKRIEAPIVIKFKDNDYDLLGGNTRLAGLLKKGINPKLWVIDMKNFYKKEESKEGSNKLKGGLSDKMSLGDIAHKHKIDVEKLTKQFIKGVKVEMEHTKDKQKAKEIAMDHLVEDPKYYDKLAKIEAKEVTGASSAGSYVGPFSMSSEFIKNSNKETPKKVEANEVQYKTRFEKDVKVAKNSDGNVFRVGDRAMTYDTGEIIRIRSLQQMTSGRTTAYYGSGLRIQEMDIDGLIPVGEEISKIEANEVTGASSSGQYSGPAMWAKSTKKKDWRGAAKPLYKGGEFVQVKGKCKRFPYCNQGDINALKIWENENLQNAIKTVSSKTGLGENTIKGILQYELGNISKKG